MNYMDRLSRVSSHIMTLTGFFHGIFRMGQDLPTEIRTNVVRHRILKCLERRGSHHLTEVSARLAVKKNTLSELLDRMVRDGLVQRSFASDDRRMTILRVTPKGRVAIREFEKGLMERIGQFLEGLEEDDRRDIVQAIESLVRILDRHDRKSGRYFPF